MTFINWTFIINVITQNESFNKYISIYSDTVYDSGNDPTDYATLNQVISDPVTGSRNNIQIKFLKCVKWNSYL